MQKELGLKLFFSSNDAQNGERCNFPMQKWIPSGIFDPTSMVV